MFKRNPFCIIHLSTETGTPPIPIYEKKFLIGRKATHLVSIPDNSISRDHVEIIIKDDEAYLTDLGTSNGTKIDGQQIPSQIPILCREGQIITLGQSTIGIVIEIFSKNNDKKKFKPVVSQVKQQQPDYQPFQYNQGNSQEAPAVSNYNDYNKQPEAPQNTQPLYQQPAYQQPVAQQPVYQQPPITQQPAYQQPISEQKPRPYSPQSENISQNPGLSEQDVINNAKEEANRLLARAKAEGEMQVRELLRNKELIDQNNQALSQQNSLDKIKETEQQAQEVLKRANSQALEILSSAQNQSQEMLKQTQNQIQSELKKSTDEVNLIKQSILDEGRKEKQRIVEGAYLERELILKEVEQIKQSIPDFTSKLQVIQSEISHFTILKKETENECNAQKEKIQTGEAQLSKIHEEYQNTLKQVELAEAKYKATLLSAQTLVQETQETLTRVARKENELNGLFEGAKIEKAEAEKYAIAIKQDGDKYSQNVKQDADKYADIAKQDADKYSLMTKHDADKYSSTTKQDADRYAQSSRTDTDADVKRKLDFLQQETEKILANRERIFQEVKTKQDHILHELKSMEESKTKSILEIDALLKSKQETMKQELAASIAEQHSIFHSQKEQLEKEFAELKETRTTEFKNIRMQQDAFLNEMRRTEEDKIRHMLDESQKMIQSQRDAKINHIQSSMDHFFGELQKTASGDVSEHIPLLRDNLKHLIKDALSNEYAGEESELKKILEYNPEIANQHKKFWKKAVIAASVIFVVIGAGIYFRSLIQQIPQQMQTSLDETDRENKLANQQKLEAIRLASVYRPPQDMNFKSDYTDNVIFIKNYMDFEYNEAAHKEWTIKLNKFLIDTVGISDDNAIKFMASESSLIRNLESKKAMIDGKNPEPGIKIMKLLEEDFEKIIDTTLKTHKEDFWNLKKEAYLKFMQENSQRFPAEIKN